MAKKDTFIGRNFDLLLLGIASATVLGALAVLSRFDTARLAAFGPTAKLYFTGIKDGLIVSAIILSVSFLIILLFRKHVRAAETRIVSFSRSLGDTKKDLLVLAACFFFAFAIHAGNIVNGYFNMDDFEVASLNRTTSLSQALFIPHGNDHALPLFRAEMKLSDTLFGSSPIPFNVFIFLIFALTPFFTWLSFKKLGFGLRSFFVFFVLFTGATGWSDMLPGFYIMTIYLQIIFFFSVSLWSYLSWQETHKKKYLFFLAFSMLAALGADISGIWVIPAMIVAAACLTYARHGVFETRKNLTDFLKENRQALVVISEVIIVFSMFLVYTFFVVQPDTFLAALNDDALPRANEKEENWRFIPLVENFVSLFSSGVSLSLVVPKIAKIIAHPSIQGSVQGYWRLLEILVFGANILILWLAVKYAAVKEKRLIFLSLGIMCITLVMVIIARPNHEPIPDYDYRYAGAAFYAYCIFLAAGTSVFMTTKKELAAKIIIPAVIIVFASQQVFGFQAVRTREESKMRRTAIEGLNKNLLSEIDQVSKKKQDGPLVIPNLSGGSIFQETLAGFTLSYYVLFFNRDMPIELIQTSAMPPDNRTRTVTTVSSLRASTSPEFKESLKESGSIREYYLSPALLSYKIVPNGFDSKTLSGTKKESVVQEQEVDPEKLHSVMFTLVTDDIPGNIELLFSFKNDFGWEGPAGRIRVDDFTPHETKDGKRIYRTETNLLQLYSYALSEKISHLVLSVPETKNAFIENIEFR